MAYIERPVDEMAWSYEIQGLARPAGRFGIGGLGAAGVSDDLKATLTQRVRELEAEERPSRDEIARVRDLLTTNVTMHGSWTDSSWRPEILGGWPSSSNLFSRVNEVHARVLRSPDLPGEVTLTPTRGAPVPVGSDPETGAPIWAWEERTTLAPAPTWAQRNLETQVWYQMPEATVETAAEVKESVAKGFRQAGEWIEKTKDEAKSTAKWGAVLGAGVLALTAVGAAWAYGGFKKPMARAD